MGQSTVPVDPQRLVVLDSPHLDAALALGIDPVGATEAEPGAGLPDYLRDQLPDRLEGVEIVGTTTEPRLEAVAALDPDLIIGAKVRHEAIYDKLSAIAPTVFSENSGTDWTEQLNLVAAALDREDEAATLLSDLDARARRIGTRIGASGSTVSMVRFLPGEFRLYGPETFSGDLLTRVGFDLGERNWDEYSMLTPSSEQFAQAEGDIIFVSTYGAAQDTVADQVTRLWAHNPAVKAGRVFPVDDDTWMLGIGVLGAALVLDQLDATAG
jgi:iron complex transport system substrate-binding protein